MIRDRRFLEFFRLAMKMENSRWKEESWRTQVCESGDPFIQAAGADAGLAQEEFLHTP